MRWIWWSIHQHKPRTMYVGPTPMLNHCRLSGSEFTLPPFSLWCGWGIWSKSAARASIHSESFLNRLFGSSWSAMAAMAKKNNPAGKQCRLSFCVSYSFLSSSPPPPSRASMICARGPVTHGSFKKQRGEIFGRSWWASGDVGVRQAGRGQRRCGASAVPLWWLEGECRGDKCPSRTWSVPQDGWTPAVTVLEAAAIHPTLNIWPVCGKSPLFLNSFFNPGPPRPPPSARDFRMTWLRLWTTLRAPTLRVFVRFCKFHVNLLNETLFWQTSAWQRWHSHNRNVDGLPCQQFLGSIIGDKKEQT